MFDACRMYILTHPRFSRIKHSRGLKKAIINLEETPKWVDSEDNFGNYRRKLKEELDDAISTEFLPETWDFYETSQQVN